MRKSIYLLVVLSLLSACEKSNTVTSTSKSQRWYCDAESLSSDHFSGEGGSFANGATQTTDYARSGKHSVLVNKDQPFAMTLKVEGVDVGDAIEISAWRHVDTLNLGSVVVSDSSAAFYVAVKEKMAREGDWELIKGLVYIGKQPVNNKISCYILNGDSRPAYYDDFEVILHKNYEYPQYADQESIQLLIGRDKMRKLQQKRDRALETGVLFSEDDDWVPAQIILEEDTFNVDMRLKGDWMDHLKGIKWSYRIKVKKGSFKGMRTFSLHTPAARNYLDEWVIHTMFEEADVLTPRYGFVPVFINGESRGVYAYEEHFDKQLVEHKKRREGPILKLNEDAAFELTAQGWSDGVTYDRSLLSELARIEPFKEGRTMKSEVLRNQFVQGQKLLYQHQNNLSPASDIYDIPLLAKLYAICDLGGTHHGLAWHNQRFYMNPVTCQLEPIAYDCFTNWVEKHRTDLSGLNATTDLAYQLDYFFQLPFQDSVMVREYTAALDKYLRKDFLDDFFSRHQEEINAYESMIAQEIPGYKFQKEAWYEGLEYAQSQLEPYKRMMHDNAPAFRPGHNLNWGGGKTPWRPVQSQSIKAYLADSTQGEYTLDIINTFSEELELVGFGTVVSMSYPLEESVMLEPHYLNLRKYRMTAPAPMCYYRVPGQEDLQRIAITWWPFPSGKTTRQNFDYAIPAAFEKRGAELHLSGNKTISSDTRIPPGFTVVIEAGTNLTISNAIFLSESPLRVEGTAEAPVKVQSKNAHGFTILQASSRSLVNYATFDGFDTMILPGWTLTGAVNFYESDVDMDHVVIRGNTCEDALNIIRSDFTLTNSEVSDCFSDGFDADFCTGTVSNCTFHHTLNDCIDFSTSQIAVTDCFIYHAGDKAVSGGENSTLTLNNVDISNSNIGVAAKDLTHIEFNNGRVDSCRYGFTLFQKKPEYGPASIDVSDVTSTKVDTLQLIEVGSVLKVDGKEVKGQSVINLDQLYNL